MDPLLAVIRLTVPSVAVDSLPSTADLIDTKFDFHSLATEEEPDEVIG
jgi:hypothetical protein